MNKALLSTGSGEWETPQELFDSLNAANAFDLDVCATADNAKCKRFFSKDQDGLTKDWTGRVWCNPPYGRDVGKWVKKANEEHAKHGTVIVMLLPARTDTKWMHDLIFGSANVIFLPGRLKFTGSNNSAPFPSMLAIWGSLENAVINLTDKLGGFGVLEGHKGKSQK